MATVYKSKIDAWVAAVLVGAIFISVFAGLKASTANSPDAGWMALLIGAPGVVLPLIALLTTRYVVKDKELIVRCGIFAWHIPFSEISDITPTSDPIASPALSLDRLRIEYGREKSVLISPRDKDGFLNQVEGLIAVRSNNSFNPMPLRGTG